MKKVLRASPTQIWILAVAGVVLLAVSNLPWQLDDYDQAKQAYTSFEMVKSGHWLYQHTPHQRIATKPPLVGWISAALYIVSRSWPLAWRLPSFLAAVALTILLFRAGEVSGRIGGLFAASAFVFNLLTPRLATLVRTDMPLALAISAIGILIWHKLRLRQPWSRVDRWILFALLTAAMLIKGPIVYAFLLPGCFVVALYQRRRCSDGAAPRPSEAATTGWWPWFASLGVFLLWVGYGARYVPGFYDQVILREFLGRFGETIHRPQPLFFYLPHLLHKFFPWSVLTILLAILNFRLWKLDRNIRSSSWAAVARNISAETWWLIGWSVGGLMVMSIIPSKRVDRIFPIIPPLCLLLSAQLAVVLANERWKKSVMNWSAVALLVAVLFTGGYGGFKIYTGYRDHRDALVQFGRKVKRAAAERHWRYGVVESDDEGLLLYLDQTRFIRPEQAAVDFWDRRTIDALVVGNDDERWRRFAPAAAAATFTPIVCSDASRPPVYCLISRP